MPASDPLLVAERDWILINPAATLWLDVEVFEQAFNGTKGIPGRDLDEQSKTALEQAVELYRGDLLDGWYQDWCLFERERLQNMFLIMLGKLMDYCEAHERYEAGLTYGMRILQCDRAHERTHRNMMRLYYLAGDRTGALRQYESCLAALDEELGVAPAKSTQALYRRVCEDEPGRRVQPPVEPTEEQVEAGTNGLTSLLADLQNVQSNLSSIQERLRRNIEVVELVLNDRR